MQEPVIPTAKQTAGPLWASPKKPVPVQTEFRHRDLRFDDVSVPNSEFLCILHLSCLVLLMHLCSSKSIVTSIVLVWFGYTEICFPKKFHGGTRQDMMFGEWHHWRTHFGHWQHGMPGTSVTPATESHADWKRR